MKKYIIPDNMCASAKEIRRVICSDPDNRETMIDPDGSGSLADWFVECPGYVITSTLDQVVECKYHDKIYRILIVRHVIKNDFEEHVCYSLDNPWEYREPKPEEI